MQDYKKILLNETLFNMVKGVAVFNIPSDIINKIKDISMEVNKYYRGFYFGHSTIPFLNKGESLLLLTGEYVTINNKDDIYNFINSGGNIILGDDIRLDMYNYNELKSLIHDTDVDVIYLPLLDNIVRYIESYYLLTEHPENDIIATDVFNISNSINLTNDLSIIYESFIDMYRDKISDIHLLDRLNEIYNELYEFFITNIDIYDRDMFRLNIGLTHIHVERMLTPSSIRYSLNRRFIDSDKLDRVEDLYLPDDNDLAIINNQFRKSELEDEGNEDV